MNSNYISWDEYFMGVAVLSSKRSKDPSTQVGACIVNPKKESLELDIMDSHMDVMIKNIHGEEINLIF